MLKFKIMVIRRGLWGYGKEVTTYHAVGAISAWCLLKALESNAKHDSRVIRFVIECGNK